MRNQIWTGVKCLLKNYSWVLNKGNPGVWITHKELNLWASHLNDKLSSKLLLSIHLPYFHTRLVLPPSPPTPRALRSLLASELLNAACWHFVIHQPLLCNLANVCCVTAAPAFSTHTSSSCLHWLQVRSSGMKINWDFGDVKRCFSCFCKITLNDRYLPYVEYLFLDEGWYKLLLPSINILNLMDTFTHLNSWNKQQWEKSLFVHANFKTYSQRSLKGKTHQSGGVFTMMPIQAWENSFTQIGYTSLILLTKRQPMYER